MTDAHHLTSELLSRAGFQHAFFTRRGGVSEGPFESLNFSISVGDEPGRVQENLERAAEILNVESGRVYFASQVHGCEALLADSSLNREQFLLREADAVIGLDGGLACAVRSADCVPILIGDRRSGAAAAIHAGWRGVVRKVVARAIQALREATGDPGDLIAAIGPHLSVAAFEVSHDVAEQLRGASDAAHVVEDSGAKPHVNLRRIVRAQLNATGVTDEHVEDVLGCTFDDPQRFFSFRRDGKRSGRHLSAIVPRGSTRALGL